MPRPRKTTTPADAKAAALAAALDAARKRLLLETLETRGNDRLDFHDLSVGLIREALAAMFDAGYAAAPTNPKPAQPTDADEVLATLQITEIAGRRGGGTWAQGTIAGHTFEALVFPGHAAEPSYELGDSRISKLCVRDAAQKTVVAFDRGWDTQPATRIAKVITDLLAAGVAETVFGR